MSFPLCCWHGWPHINLTHVCDLIVVVMFMQPGYRTAVLEICITKKFAYY